MNPPIHLLNPPNPFWGHESLSQLLLDEGGVHKVTQPHTLTLIPIGTIQSHQSTYECFWTVGVPGGNPHVHWTNMQTLHRKEQTRDFKLKQKYKQPSQRNNFCKTVEQGRCKGTFSAVACSLPLGCSL